MSRVCPDCAIPLENRPLHGLMLDVCPACAGIYFDEGEIGQLTGEGPGAVREVEEAAAPDGIVFIDSPTPKACPGCGTGMRNYAYRYSSKINLDGCDRCGGVWVQDGELAKIAEYLDHPPSTFGGIPAARQATETRNAEGLARHKSAVRHAGLVERVRRLMTRR